MSFAVTDAALLQAQNIALESGNSVFRVYLEGKGCDGFFYGLCQSETLSGDITQGVGDLTFVVDADTLLYVRGSTIDWVDDDRGRGFLINNPNHERFRGKFFKRPSWQKYYDSQKQKSDSGAVQ